MQDEGIFGQWADTNGVDESVVNIDPEEVVRRFIGKMRHQFHFYDMKRDPIDFFKGDGLAELSLAVAVALDLLAVPAGEAPAERIFSIASRIIGTGRAVHVNNNGLPDNVSEKEQTRFFCLNRTLSCCKYMFCSVHTGSGTSERTTGEWD